MPCAVIAAPPRHSRTWLGGRHKLPAWRPGGHGRLWAHSNIRGGCRGRQLPVGGAGPSRCAPQALFTWGALGGRQRNQAAYYWRERRRRAGESRRRWGAWGLGGAAWQRGDWRPGGPVSVHVFGRGGDLQCKTGHRAPGGRRQELVDAAGLKWRGTVSTQQRQQQAGLCVRPRWRDPHPAGPASPRRLQPLHSPTYTDHCSHLPAEAATPTSL